MIKVGEMLKTEFRKRNDLNLNEHGIEIIDAFIPISITRAIIKQVSESQFDYPRHGIRNADKKFSTIRELVESEVLMNKASKILGSTVSIVRVIFFDKTTNKNWLVSWHQDKTISVSDKKEVAGWGFS